MSVDSLREHLNACPRLLHTCTCCAPTFIRSEYYLCEKKLRSAEEAHSDFEHEFSHFNEKLNLLAESVSQELHLEEKAKNKIIQDLSLFPIDTLDNFYVAARTFLPLDDERFTFVRTLFKGVENILNLMACSERIKYLYKENKAKLFEFAAKNYNCDPQEKLYKWCTVSDL